MQPRIPERHKQRGVCYAFTDDGIELPVVDITHPAFSGEVSQAELAAICAATLRSMRRSAKLPAFLVRLMARRSIVMRGTLQAAGSFLSGMATYLQKVGPQNLGAGYARAIDRQLLASIGPVGVRLRLRQVARLLADELAVTLPVRGGPLHLLNVGGGTAMDSLNALILLQREHPAWLAGRRICIHVLDLDEAGPRFGARALAALQADEGALQGLEVSLVHIRHDWANLTELRRVLAALAGADTVVAGSSEGGLFEYGPDEVVAANLHVLRESTPDDFVIVGTAVRDEEVLRVMKDLGKLTLQLRELAPFRALIEGAGWAVAQLSAGNPLYHVFSARKAGAARADNGG